MLTSITTEEITSNNSSEKFFDNLVWMTSREAAQYLRKTEGALRTAVCRGQIRCKKWRRRLYFLRSELQKLLENSQQIGGL